MQLIAEGAQKYSKAVHGNASFCILVSGQSFLATVQQL